MTKKQELINILKEYPDHKLIVMYDSEGGNSDYSYTLGEIQRIEVTETTIYNDERVFTSDEYDELLEIVEEDITAEKYGYSKILSDDELNEVNTLAKEEIGNYKWESVIVIYVGS